MYDNHILQNRKCNRCDNSALFFFAFVGCIFVCVHYLLVLIYILNKTNPKSEFTELMSDQNKMDFDYKVLL